MTDGMGTPYGTLGVQEYYPDINMDTQYYYSPAPQEFNSYPPTQMNSPPQDYTSYPPPQMGYQYDYIKPQMTPAAPPSNQNMIQYEFDKAQMEILLDEPMEQGDGQMEYPAGELLPWEQQKPQEFVPFVGGNNNNNNNNNFIQPSQNLSPWGQPLDPVELRVELRIPAVDRAQEEVDKEIDVLVKKEQERVKAKGYSAKCLAKKGILLQTNLKKAEDLKDKAATLDVEIQLSQKNLEFAVNDVLIPILGDNNSNHDITAFKKIELQKEAIIQQITQKKMNDEEYQKKFSTLQTTKNELAQAEFDQKHKDTIPVYVEDTKGRRIVSNTTLATRISRKKKQLETCQSDYEAAVQEYKIKRLERIKQLLDNYWTSFKPYLRPILENPPPELWQRLEWHMKTDQFCYLREFLLKPP
ncbi:unnamed protein product [Caenorhabditis brenneri]